MTPPRAKAGGAGRDPVLGQRGRRRRPVQAFFIVEPGATLQSALSITHDGAPVDGHWTVGGVPPIGGCIDVRVGSEWGCHWPRALRTTGVTGCGKYTME